MNTSFYSIFGLICGFILIWAITIILRREVVRQHIPLTIVVLAVSVSTSFLAILLPPSEYFYFILGFGTIAISFLPLFMLTIVELNDEVNLLRGKDKLVSIATDQLFFNKDLKGETRKFLDMVHKKMESGDISREIANEVNHLDVNDSDKPN